MNYGPILVTGGAGYVGSHINKQLNKLGYKTVVVDSLIRGNKESIKWGNFEKICLSDINKLENIFSKYEFSTVMHFAAFAYVEESMINPAIYYQNNLSSTINLLNTMIKFNVKNFIFSSSCATYGIPEILPISEKTPQKPISPYGKSKRMVESLLSDYDEAYNLKYINLRYFNAAGCDPECEIGEKHQPETHLIPRVIEAALNDKSFTIYGNDYDTKDGTCVRDFVHVNDLATAHIKAMNFLDKYSISDSFNIGTGSGHTIIEVVECVEKILNKKIDIIYSRKRKGDPAELYSSNEKAISKLGWQPKYIGLEEIVQTAANWFMKLYKIV